ncbi:MAG: hypothetical protein Q9160_003428 [Pyrenula sp. 1 TL-2023]
MRFLLCWLAIQLPLQAFASSVSCPEDIGALPPSCESCGGEDPANAGHCKNASPAGTHCQCKALSKSSRLFESNVLLGNKNAPSGSLTTSVITATQSGKTVTGTFALETITSLSSLRQSITTTVTATPTSGGEAKTAAAVILAGGVAWLLAEAIGDAAVVEAAIEAPEAPEGHKDDKTCPNPEHKCSDCGGVASVCVTKDGGCRCNNGKCTIEDVKNCDCEESCPKGDQQPTCDSDDCKGVDGKCTIKNKGCECKDSCPDHEMTPFCDDCGGNNNKKCKGIADQGNKFKDCDCLELPKQIPGYMPFGSQLPDWKNDYNNIPDVSDKSYDDQFEGSPKCNMDEASRVREQWFRGLYPQFCSQIKDKKKEFHADLTNKDYKAPTSSRRSLLGFLGARTPPPSATDYDDFKFSFDWKPADGQCWKECNEAFADMASSPCGHTAGDMNIMAKKTDYDIGCGTYKYEITPKADEPEAPPEKKCESGDSNFYMSYGSITRNIGEFCDKLNSMGPVKGGTKLNPPETYNKGTMDQVDFTAEWEGDDKTLYTEVNKDKCKAALGGFIDGCNVPTGKKTQYGDPEKGSNSLNWKHGGSYKEAGITYKISPTAKRHTPAPDDNRGLTSCAVWYKGFWDTFDIWGYGMISADYGQDVLLHKLRACGAVTKWKFDYYVDGPQDAPWPTFKGAEWHAYGRLPIGPQMWSCVGDAIQASGHPTAGSCAGQ